VASRQVISQCKGLFLRFSYTPTPLHRAVGRVAEVLGRVERRCNGGEIAVIERVTGARQTYRRRAPRDGNVSLAWEMQT
jgi:hypothetical protein